MHEAFIQYLWKYQKFTRDNLKTTAGEQVVILNPGQHNYHAGPDFFNAQIRIDEQLWAGNVEIHLKSSNWYIHNHQQDRAYDNVILHVVWEHDTEIYRKDNSPVPTLVLQHYVNTQLLDNYTKLAATGHKWLYCETHFPEVDEFLLNNWLERLYVERLERKALQVEALLQQSKNNWEAVCFQMLTKYFGLKVNGEAFASLAKSIPWSTLQKTAPNLQQLEALLMGQAGLLEGTNEDAYYQLLQKEYNYLVHKFKLSNNSVLPVQFFRLRPANFPTARLAQLAALYHNYPNLFAQLITIRSKTEAYKYFQVKVSPYWETHVNFSSPTKKSSKKLSKPFIDLLLINTVLPLQYAYAKYLGKSATDNILELAQDLAPESNAIISKFNSLRPVAHSALQTQALLQLKTEYCNKQKCLDCALGNSYLKSSANNLW